MYQLYVQTKSGSREKIGNGTNSLEEIYSKILPTTLSERKDLFSYMIILHSPAGDDIIERKELYKECKVEFSNNVKTKYKVNATTFKPSRMKEKEELRKMTEEYLK